MDAFPLQTNLRRLKPNAGRLVMTLIVVVGVIVNQFSELRSLSPATFLVGASVAIILIGSIVTVVNMVFRKIYFNEFGVGVSRGGSETWYSFDELLEARWGKRMMGQLKPASRLFLRFYTGTVRIYSSAYHTETVTELAEIISRRTPVVYGKKGKLDDTQSGKNSYSKPEAPEQTVDQSSSNPLASLGTKLKTPKNPWSKK